MPTCSWALFLSKFSCTFLALPKKRRMMRCGISTASFGFTALSYWVITTGMANVVLAGANLDIDMGSPTQHPRAPVWLPVLPLAPAKCFSKYPIKKSQSTRDCLLVLLFTLVWSLKAMISIMGEAIPMGLLLPSELLKGHNLCPLSAKRWMASDLHYNLPLFYFVTLFQNSFRELPWCLDVYGRGLIVAVTLLGSNW